MRKKYKYKQVGCLLTVLAILFSFSLSVSAQEDSTTPSLTEATAVWFYHLESQTAILSKNEEQTLHAGSTVKIMAGLLLCRALEERLSEQVTVVADMLTVPAGYRQLYLQAEDSIPVEQLLYAALCGGYNDAYEVLACYTYGSSQAFVDEMNREAKKIGAKSTLFSDVTGIDDNSYTTASELALVAMAAAQNELYMKITSTQRYSFAATEKMSAKTFYNRNELIAASDTKAYYNSKCRGMNAGYTVSAGYCVVTLATYKDNSYLCIVMDGTETTDKNYAYTITNRLIEWVYDTYAMLEIISPKTVVCTLPVSVSDTTSEVEIRTNQALSCLLPSDAVIGEDITYSVRLLYTSLEAPVSEGIMVGYVAVLYNGKVLDTLPLYTAESAERSSFISSIKSIQALTESRVFRAGAVFFVAVLCAWIITEYILAKKRKHKWDKYFSDKLSPPPTAAKKKNGNHGGWKH